MPDDDVLHGQSFPQVVVRIGWPPLSNSPIVATPRRHLDQVLEFSDDN